MHTLPDRPTLEDPEYLHKGLIHRANHLSRILQHFRNRWKKEYLLELREFHRTREEKGSTYIVNEGDIVTVYDKGHPKGLWRLGKKESLIHGADGVVQRVPIRVMSKGGHPKLLRKPLQHIYPLEVRCEPTAEVSSGATHNAELGEADEPIPFSRAHHRIYYQ